MRRMHGPHAVRRDQGPAGGPRLATRGQPIKPRPEERAAAEAKSGLSRHGPAARSR